MAGYFHILIFQHMKLATPKFIKVKDLETERSGYNVVVQVLEAEHRVHEGRNGGIPMVDCIVGDESAKVKAFFKGDNTKLVNKGNVIAIRNGVKRIINGTISLEVDIFGRVTEEKDKIEGRQNAENISEKKVVFEKSNRPPKRNNRNLSRFKNNQPRKWENQNNRPNNRNTFRNDRNDRSDRNNQSERNIEKNNRFEKRERKNDGDFNRRSQNGPRETKFQQRRFEEKREQRGDRNPMVKINEMDPGQQNIRFIAKVLECKLIQGRFNKLRCLLGDETGTVQAFLPDWDVFKVGASLAFSRAEARVVKQHIQIQLPQTGRAEQARNKIQKVNETFNLSEKSWVPVD